MKASIIPMKYLTLICGKEYPWKKFENNRCGYHCEPFRDIRDYLEYGLAKLMEILLKFSFTSNKKQPKRLSRQSFQTELSEKENKFWLYCSTKETIKLCQSSRECEVSEKPSRNNSTKAIPILQQLPLRVARVPRIRLLSI